MVLITGANGFIGSKLRGKAFKGCITDRQALVKQTQDVHGIVHLAAKSNKKACESDIEGCINANLLGLNNVLDVALKRKIWVLFISTFQVRDKNIYGLSKLMGEELCRLYAAKGLRVGILRLPIVYGPGDRPYKIVTKFIDLLKAGKEPTIETEDKFYFAYVDDVAERIQNEIGTHHKIWGKKKSLTDLVAGIKKCLNENKK